MTTYTLAERLPWAELDHRIKPTAADYQATETMVARLNDTPDRELATRWGIKSKKLRKQLRDAFEPSDPRQPEV